MMLYLFIHADQEKDDAYSRTNKIEEGKVKSTVREVIKEQKAEKYIAKANVGI
jgi:hypothetical protein